MAVLRTTIEIVVHYESGDDVRNIVNPLVDAFSGFAKAILDISHEVATKISNTFADVGQTLPDSTKPFAN